MRNRTRNDFLVLFRRIVKRSQIIRAAFVLSVLKQINRRVCVELFIDKRIKAEILAE